MKKESKSKILLAEDDPSTKAELGAGQDEDDIEFNFV